MNRQRFSTPFLTTIIIAGAGVSLFSLFWMRHTSQTVWTDANFWVLAVLTVTIASRISIPVPRVSGAISVSDTFLFLAVLLFGGDVAVILAAIEGMSSTRRVSKRARLYMFNASVMALATFASVWTLRICFGWNIADLQSDFSGNLVMATCVMALVQYAVNTTLVAFAQSLKINQPFWQTWCKYYLWTSITYFAGAAAAAIVARAIHGVGFYAVIVATPIIVIVYFTYRMYLKNIEASVHQAEQAEQHILQLQQSEERFRSAFDFAAIGMALVAESGKWLQVNHSLSQLVGFTEDEMLATDFQSLTHTDDLPAALAGVRGLLQGTSQTFQMEKRYRHHDGHAVWVLWSVSQATDARTQAVHLIFQIQDITDRKRAEERLQHDAFHDALTGLPNRALFIDHLKMAMKRTTRNAQYQYAVLFLDLDRFKVINDSLGHMSGDQLLIEIARRLENCLHPGDTVARLGGDEFTILLEDITDVSDAIAIAERIKLELARPFHLSGSGDGSTGGLHEVFTTASVGITHSGHGYTRPADLLRDADTAMYRAKSLGKTRHEVFDPAMHQHAANLLQMENDLRRAVERREFVVYYQPIIELETGKIGSFEALVRWQHPELGFVSPADFIPLAEETGLIVPLGEMVLREACRQMRAWQRRFDLPDSVTMSVNLSGKQFAQTDLMGSVKQVLKETGLAPQHLKLEITESVVMENITTATETLHHLHDFGISLSIDDFGTGYSSLSYLHRFPASTLKIDRSFVSQMSHNNENTEIVRTIRMLAQSLGMDIVAEGVETQEQLTQLQALGCEYGQGYLFSRPVAAEPAAALLAKDYAVMMSDAPLVPAVINAGQAIAA